MCLRFRCLVYGVFALALIVPLSSPAQTLRFDFGSGPVAEGHTQVTSATLYTPERGYGFEVGDGIADADGGVGGTAVRDYCVSDKPFYFSAKVPEGNYRVKLWFAGNADAPPVTVKAELRRLLLENVSPYDEENGYHGIAVNIRTPQLPDGRSVGLKERERTSEARAWDEKLTLEFNGAHPAIAAIEIARDDTIPTVYLLGDSTVCDQPREPWTSWGQMLTPFFNWNVSIANHAESGESLRGALGARRVAKILSLLKAGDYLFVQFGHNDMKDRAPNASDTFKQNLLKLVADVRAKGATPVLVTSMERKSGIEQDTLKDYPEKVREVARETDSPLVDLHAMSKVLYKALGDDLDAAFQDGTHHNAYGSYQLAQCVVLGIRENKLPLADYIVNFADYNPARPDPVSEFNVPPSPDYSVVKPLGD